MQLGKGKRGREGDKGKRVRVERGGRGGAREEGGLVERFINTTAERVGGLNLNLARETTTQVPCEKSTTNPSQYKLR